MFLLFGGLNRAIYIWRKYVCICNVRRALPVIFTTILSIMESFSKTKMCLDLSFKAHMFWEHLFTLESKLAFICLDSLVNKVILYALNLETSELFGLL